MTIGLSESLQFQGRALLLRAQRQEILAGNIANADTPNYKARDIDFAKALTAALPDKSTSVPGASSLRASHPAHLERNGAAAPTPAQAGERLYRLPEQASGDGNTVDMDRERANFADNALRYEATLKFINGRVRNLLSAIRGD